MGSVIGQSIKLSLFGESHGEGVGIVIDGLPAGIHIDLDLLKDMMNKRKSINALSTLRKEEDKVDILSGYYNNYTTGTPLTLFIKNTSQNSSVYEKTKDLARPGHADYTANLKYHGFQDYRGGGHFSGRLTSPIVAAGSIATSILKQKGIIIGSHILNLHQVKDESFSTSNIDDEINKVNSMVFPVLNDEIAPAMKEEIIKAKNNLDSVGGIIESAILIKENVVLGEPFFNSLESKLSSYLFSIGGVKGIEFGLGFDFANHYGSEVKDEFKINNNKVITTTNNNGGINGGISNLQPIILKVVVKPTPSIYQAQNTINMQTNKEETIQIQGRHDPAIIHRAVVVINSMIALALLDLYAYRYGNEKLR